MVISLCLPACLLSAYLPFRAASNSHLVPGQKGSALTFLARVGVSCCCCIDVLIRRWIMGGWGGGVNVQIVLYAGDETEDYQSR